MNFSFELQAQLVKTQSAYFLAEAYSANYLEILFLWLSLTGCGWNPNRFPRPRPFVQGTSRSRSRGQQARHRGQHSTTLKNALDFLADKDISSMLIKRQEEISPTNILNKNL